MQSRYYDPAIGRFINADSLVSTGQGVLGNNMFAYCGNNPVSRADFSGHAFMQIDYNYSDNLSILCPTLSFGSSGGGRSCTGSQTYKNTKKLASEKSSEVAAHSNLEEYGVTLYKGALVVAVDWMESSAVSFGVIFIGSDNLDDPEFADTLNHEYGHFVHFTQIGVVAYTATTALPSLVGAGLSYYVPFIDENYMSQPWERIANQLGGVNDVYLPGADTAGALYYYFTLLVSAVIP